MVSVFGERNTTDIRPVKGYNRAYTFGYHSFYFSICYHENYMDMYVTARFSAQALDYYCHATGLAVFQMLQVIQDPFYSVRLSRIDLTADFYDEDFTVTEIYQDLIDNRIAVFREKVNVENQTIDHIRQPLIAQGYLRDKDIPTIYLGSPKSSARLRIYDKKRQQLETKGCRLDDAKKVNSWVRFEVVLRNEYAHQMTDAMLSITNDGAYRDLIASAIGQKFHIMYLDNGKADCETEYTQMILDCIQSKGVNLKAPVSRNYDLARGLIHLFGGSGTVSTLYKINQIWGTEALVYLLEYLVEYLAEWVPNDDCRYWLQRNKSDCQRSHPDFPQFMRECLAAYI